MRENSRIIVSLEQEWRNKRENSRIIVSLEQEEGNFNVERRCKVENRA